ncbi:hypothetical protein J2T37_002288 [Neisseria perflava]|nr:hypothetical protein [Neisseria perflava]MCP1773408.1 hypothetical protein [Neisseria perflava]
MAERPESKPIYDSVRQVKTYERIAACISGGKSGCTCYSDQATPLKEITKAMCEKYAKDGIPFNPYKEPETQNMAKAQAQHQTADSDGQPSQIVSLGGKSQQNLMYDNLVSRDSFGTQNGAKVGG